MQPTTTAQPYFFKMTDSVPQNKTPCPFLNNLAHVNSTMYTTFYKLWISLMVLNSLIFFVGIVLNSLAIYVFCFRTKNKTTSVIYTINLIITDLLVGLSLPTRIIMYYTDGSCHACSFVHIFGYFVNMYCSILFLTCICVDRYLAIVQVEASRKWRNPNFAKGMCVFIWLFAIVVTISILTSAINVPSCCLFQLFMLTVFEYFLPLVIITLFTIRIMCALSKTSLMHQSRERRMRAVQLLVTVLIIFTICFTPFHVSQVAICVKPDIPSDVSMIIYHVTVTLSSLNSCMDPIVYCFVTNNFQTTVKNIFKRNEQGQTNADIISMQKSSKGSGTITAISNLVSSPVNFPLPSSAQL